MKTLFYLFVITVFITTVSCKSVRNKEVTVVRDCTGTYIRMNDKDYHVCNSELLSSYENGAKLKVTFRKAKECKARENEIVCMMFHENEGWVEIRKINQ